MQDSTKNNNYKTLTHYILTHSENLKRYAGILTHSTIDNADDLYQETIYRCLNNAHNYTHRGTTEAWIKTIMRNIHINELRNANNKTTQYSEEYEICDENTPDEETYSIEDLYRAIELLGKSEQEIIVMRIRGYSYDEIAEATHKKVGTIKSTIHRIKAHLKILLEE